MISSIKPQNIYDKVENKLLTTEAEPTYFFSKKKISNNYEIVRLSSDISTSSIHIYEEIDYTNEIKQKKTAKNIKLKQKTPSFKKIKKTVFSFYQTIRSKTTNRTSRDVNVANQTNNTTVSNGNNDYEYVCYSCDTLSTKQKKALRYHHTATDNKVNVNKNQHKTNSQNIEQKNSDYEFVEYGVNSNDYSIQQSKRVLDKNGYEVPVCQQKNNLLFRKYKENNINSKNDELINKNESQKITLPDESNSNLKNIHLEPIINQEDCVDTSQTEIISVTIHQSPKDSELPAVTKKTNNEVLYNNLKGLVQKRKSMFEQLLNPEVEKSFDNNV